MAMLSKGEKEVLKVIKQGISTTESISSLQSTNNQLDNSIATTEELLHVRNTKVVGGSYALC